MNIKPGHLASAIALVLTILVLNLLASLMLPDGCLKSSAGNFGDLFGAANALFSGLAFVGIIGTLLLQQHDLKQTQLMMAKQNDLAAKSARLGALPSLIRSLAEHLQTRYKHPLDGFHLETAEAMQITKWIEDNFPFPPPKQRDKISSTQSKRGLLTIVESCESEPAPEALISGLQRLASYKSDLESLYNDLKN
jgi:hypothetical protein